MRYKFIIKGIVFLSGIFIILVVLSYWFIPPNSIEEGPYKKLGGILSAPKNTIDFLVVGDSECNSSISPMEIYRNYGYVGYNCGVPGQRMQDNYYMLENLLQNQSPKVILLETNALYRNFKYAEALQDNVDEEVKKILPIYKYHNYWKFFSFDMVKNIKLKSHNRSSNLFKGFHYSTAVKPYVDGPYVEKTNKIKEIEEQPLSYLNKIVKLCREHHIQLILYCVPSPLCWTYEKHNGTAAFADQNNLTFLDLNLYNDKLGIDWLSDTRDRGNHLNFDGARKVTNYIGSYLSTHSELTDHRKDKRYFSWNNALKKYLKLTNQD